MKNPILIILSILTVNFLFAQEIKMIEADGNLESPKPLECICLAEVTNQNNPADILNGLEKCVQLGEYKKAAHLFAISGVYGTYDKFRVKDKSGHQALLLIQKSVFSRFDQNQIDTLMKNLNKELEKGSESLLEICSAIQSIGVPKYHPKYMIQHGINAFNEEIGNGLVEDYDSLESFNKSLEEYLHCGE